MCAYRMPEDTDEQLMNRPLGLNEAPASMLRAPPLKKLRPKSAGFSAALIAKAIGHDHSKTGTANSPPSSHSYFLLPILLSSSSPLSSRLCDHRRQRGGGRPRRVAMTIALSPSRPSAPHLSRNS